MSAQLNKYKLAQLNILRINYNRALAILTNLITKINQSRATRANKNQQILIIISKINTLRQKYNNNVQYIKLLKIRTRNPDKFALLIGINYKETPYELFGCIRDTENIKQLLTSHFSYPAQNIVIVTDDAPQKPTKQTILSQLTTLLTNSIAGDTLFLLYSGHGSYTTDLNRDELDNQDELIVSLDLQFISDDELFNVIKTNLKPGVTLFALFDSCFSGTVLDLHFNYLPSSNNDNPTTSGQIILISSCLDNQTSSEANTNNGNMGALCAAFLNTIQTDNSNQLNYNTLIESMRNFLLDNRFKQITQLSSGQHLDILSLCSF